jgi:cytochrome c553
MGRGGKAGLIAAGWLAGALPVLADDLPEKLAEKLAPCLACHGVEGQSILEYVPSLGAQTAPYALIQLFMFREKMRVAEPMTEAAQGLSDGDLQAMSDALAAQPPPKPPDDPSDPTRLERARAVTEQHRCNFCHRPDYSGQQSVPRLADQREDYLLKSLREYKSGARRAYEPIMVEVLQPTDDSQLIEFAYYLSHLR